VTEPLTARGGVNLALERAERRLLSRLRELEARLDGTSDDAWHDYLATVQVLVLLARERVPGRLLTTRELATQLGVNERTIRRQRKAGALTPALARGRVIRWATDSVPRGTATGTASAIATSSATGFSLSRAVRGQRSL
jgi:hypothetical protein